MQIILAVGCSLFGHLESLKNLVVVRGVVYDLEKTDVTEMVLEISDKIIK